MAIDKKYYLIRDGIVYFNDYVTEVISSDFHGKSLMEVKLGERATLIGEETFEGNYLRSITFHKKMKRIDARAFARNKIEKIVFERSDVPVIARDAFENNPVKMIVVPYQSLDKYHQLLDTIDLPEDYELISDIEKKFNDLKLSLREDEVIYIEATTLYGELYWKILKDEKVDLASKLKKDHNPENFSELSVSDGTGVNMYTDDHFNVLLYKCHDGKFEDMTFSEFEELYYVKR